MHTKIYNSYNAIKIQITPLKSFSWKIVLFGTSTMNKPARLHDGVGTYKRRGLSRPSARSWIFNGGGGIHVIGEWWLLKNHKGLWRVGRKWMTTFQIGFSGWQIMRITTNYIWKKVEMLLVKNLSLKVYWWLKEWRKNLLYPKNKNNIMA
jgi:hypothetical protein